MLNKNDKVLEMRLYSPHKCDFICKREDGTHYLYVKCDWTGYYEVHREGNQWICGEKIDDPN
jgi:hypothetical protein